MSFFFRKSLWRQVISVPIIRNFLLLHVEIKTKFFWRGSGPLRSIVPKPGIRPLTLWRFCLPYHEHVCCLQVRNNRFLLVVLSTCRASWATFLHLSWRLFNMCWRPIFASCVKHHSHHTDKGTGAAYPHQMDDWRQDAGRRLYVHWQN